MTLSSWLCCGAQHANMNRPLIVIPGHDVTIIFHALVSYNA